MNFDPTTQTGKVYRCTACPETFDTPQKLGTHVSQSHRNGPRPRQIRVRNATAKKGFMLEVIVRTHASPSVETRTTFRYKNARALQEQYQALVLKVSEFGA